MSDPAIASPQTKSDVLAQEFLVVRAKLLEAAAALDRFDRAPGALPPGDRRRELLAKAVGVLSSPEPDRAERLQLLFSRQYDPEWRTALDV